MQCAFLLFHALLLASLMSSVTQEDADFAAALNRAGLIGVADGGALEKFVMTYLALPGCDSEPSFPQHYELFITYTIIGDEDFEGHYLGKDGN